MVGMKSNQVDLFNTEIEKTMLLGQTKYPCSRCENSLLNTHLSYMNATTFWDTIIITVASHFYHDY